MEKILREKLPDGKFKHVSIARSCAMRSVKGKGNKTTEQRFTLALTDAGMIGWEINAKLMGNPDIVFPRYNLAIFLDGCFWHGCPRCGHLPKTNAAYWQTKIERNKERDKMITRCLIANEYTVVRFWEHELLHEMQHCLDVVEEIITDRLSSSLYNYWLDDCELSS